MSTSNSVNYNNNRNEIILDALIKLGVQDITETSIDPDYLDYTNRELNRLVKSLQAEGLPLWTKKTAYLFLASGDHQYALGSAGAHCTEAYVKTQVATAAASGATSLVVDSATGMTISDYIGIELDDGTMQWTTITNIASTTLTLNTALTDDVAVDNYVFTYTTDITRPLRILDANILDVNGYEINLRPITWQEYKQKTNKGTDADPTEYMYDKQLSNGQLYLYPEPNDVTKIVSFTYQKSLQDFDSSTDDPDFPQEWLKVLILGLAVEIAPAFGAYTELTALKPLADEARILAQTFDSEDAPIQFYPVSY